MKLIVKTARKGTLTDVLNNQWDDGDEVWSASGNDYSLTLLRAAKGKAKFAFRANNVEVEPLIVKEGNSIRLVDER